MRSFKVPMFVFSHTMEEMTGILEGIAASLRRGTRAYEKHGRMSPNAREAVDAAVRARWTSGDLEELIGNLEGRLAELGVRRCETPEHLASSQIDEQELAAVLQARVQYRSKRTLEKDLDSLAAVERLRAGSRPRELRSTRALFVTANPRLAAASRAFFRGANRDAQIPHCDPRAERADPRRLLVGERNDAADLPRLRRSQLGFSQGL